MAELTLVVGPGAGSFALRLAAELGAPSGRIGYGEPGAYTRALVSCFMRVALRGAGVLWLPEPAPALDAHQRRSLERIAQGLRPAVLFEEGYAPAAGSWVKTPALGASRGLGQAHLRLSPASSASSRSSAPLSAQLGLTQLRPLNPGPGTGSSRPAGVLLVGNRPNPRTWLKGRHFQPVNWPFISQLGTGCSAWLSAQLELSGAPESRLYWVNAYRADGEPSCDLAALRDRLAPQLVVALGKEAAARLEADGVRFAQVHHPQFWKRFHSSDAYQLVKLLARCRLPAQ